MLRGTASKVMWVGRATVFLVGLSVIVAVVLGVATTALGATGGNFILGKGNGAGAVTRLTSNIAGPALRLINNSTSSAATALELQVAAGHAPFRVNSSEKVANLNADNLDGKSEADFYAAGSKVADSELLDGIDSTEFAAAYERTVVVSPVGTDTENGQALLDAMDSITDASASKPYLLHIEPATYDLGNGSLNMKPFVDIEGSGELNTVITSGVSGDCPPGTVNGADNAEMRFLVVRNTSTGNCSPAISNNSASPRLTHVSAEATGAAPLNVAVLNSDGSNPKMTDVTATASGATIRNIGVDNQINSSPTMTDVTATASGASPGNYGVNNTVGSNPKMTDVTATASGGTQANRGVDNFNSSPTMTDVTATASADQQNASVYGVRNEGSSPTMTGVTATASGGRVNHGVANASNSTSNSNPTMTDVTATASGGRLNFGVRNDGSSPIMTDVIATASGASQENHGVVNNDGSSPTIRQSELRGGSASLLQAGGTAQVAHSQLVGEVQVGGPGASVQCFNNYDENMAAVACP